MATKNDITNDTLITKASSKAYRNNYDAIFSKKDKNAEEEQEKAMKELVELSEELKLYD